MQPYYSDDFVTIYHGDAADLTVDPDESWPVLLTDPPYGFGAYATDTEPPLIAIDTLKRTSRTSAIFGYPETLVAWCVEMGWVPDEWVTWWATNAITGRAKYLQREQECVAIFGEVPGAGRVRLPRSDNSARIARVHDSAKDKTERIAGDVWRDAKPGMAFNAHLRLHPNEKPMTLMRRLVELCSEPHDTVIDPFMGSGTTLRAAKDLGRKAIGVELSERYCEIAAKRCAQEVLAV